VPRPEHEAPEYVALRGAGQPADSDESQDVYQLIDQYRPMLRLLSDSDLACVKRQGYLKTLRFRKERASIYFQYLGELCRDLRALPLWTATNDVEAFIELDKASWMMQKLLAKLALEGALYLAGIPRRDGALVKRCFDRLGKLLIAAA
jgi:hypothetical protein